MQVLENGALLISGGRPGLNLWASPDGFGKTWESYDIPTEHNKLIADPKNKYCDAFLNANASLGWAQSSGTKEHRPQLSPDIV